MANSSYYASGGTSAPPERTYEPPVDKDRFYRTNKIFEGAYKKSIKLEEGKNNQTDCVSTVWVKFADPLDCPIVEDQGPTGTRHRYLLKCGHEWEGKTETKRLGDMLPCMKCGADQSYLGFEHEWQHIIFKTNPEMAKVFIGPWAADLMNSAPYVDYKQLEQFLFFVLNAFDDIRCNSLWELLYAGSADRIWQRWTRLSLSRSIEDNSTNFIAFLFAVALGTPTDPNGPYEEMRPDIEWGMQRVRYKGFARAMTIARVSLERCLGKIISRMQPTHAPQLQGASNAQTGSGQEGQSDDSDVSHSDGDESVRPGDGGGEPGAGQGTAGEVRPGVAGGAPVQGTAPHPPQPPSAGGAPFFPPVAGSSQSVASTRLASMIRGSTVFDEKEKHEIPVEPIDPTTLPDTAKAAIAKALQTHPYDPQLEQDLVDGQIDVDMQSAIDSFRDGVSKLSPDSQLTSDAKAKALFIDVKKDGIDPHAHLILSTKEKDAVTRMRSIFFRTLGRQKAQRDASGLSIDIDAAIQHSIEPNDPEIFENEQSNQGFAYLTLCDMSGSMNGVRFNQVCHATEMLKQSLHFPFVDGTLWGFRGGDPISGSREHNSEVWIYRYDKNCQGYEGKGKTANRSFTFPVRCGGLTPMHAAVRISVRHLLTRVSSGMAKRLFLLTDGAPCGVRSSGKGLPPWVLQQYVAKEIQWARQHGIQVYTLVIDGGLEEKESRLMFGAPRYWRNVSSQDPENSIDRVLQNLVIQNFEKYLKSRG
jgi:hypothetical protein